MVSPYDSYLYLMNTSNIPTVPFELSHKAFIGGHTQKTNIVIHGSLSRTKHSFTAAQNTETHLMQNWNIMADKYAGHYVIGRDGTIYSCIHEDYWANHLGNHKKFSELNKKTIAIFLCNEMYLEKENSKYYAFGFNKPHNMYKGKVFEYPFMGYNYWADYDEAQITSLGFLLKDICARQDIKPVFKRNTTNYSPGSISSAGILSCGNLNDRSYSLPFPDWVSNKLEACGLSSTE